jgi:hypothetical protein
MKRRKAVKKNISKKSFLLQNEEISSEEGENVEVDEREESDLEEPEEKRKRLSKSYLNQIIDAESAGSDAEENHEFIGSKLKQSRLLGLGKMQRDLTDQLEQQQWSDLPTRRLYGHQGLITSLSLASDDTYIATGSKDNSVLIWFVNYFFFFFCFL